MDGIPYSPENLIYVRKELKLSRQDVQDGTGIDQATIYKYEKGYRRNGKLVIAEPTVGQLEELGRFFTRVAKQKVKFVCEWDERMKEEYRDQSLYEEQLKPKLLKTSEDPKE